MESKWDYNPRYVLYIYIYPWHQHTFFLSINSTLNASELDHPTVQFHHFSPLWIDIHHPFTFRTAQGYIQERFQKIAMEVRWGKWMHYWSATIHHPFTRKNGYWRWVDSSDYPLVNVYKKLWNITMLSMGKSTCSMAIFNSYVTNYQRVKQQ